MGGVAVVDLGQRPEPCLPELARKPGEKHQSLPGARLAADAEQRVDVRSEQPRPHRALVVGTIAFDDPTLVASLVARVGGIEGAQTERGQQSLLDDGEDACSGPETSRKVVTVAVQPVWWLAPTPRPVSPSKYS